MLKKMLAFLFAFAVAGTCHSYAEDWQYLGEFTLPLDYNYARDPLILNHLGIMKSSYGSYRYFKVYYCHSHAGDQGQSNEYVTWGSFEIKGKVVPLDSKTFKTEERTGLYNSYVISDVVIRNKGVFSVIPQSLAAYDSSNGAVLFQESGELPLESLYSGSAAEYMINLSGPHPTYEGAVMGIRSKY